MAHFYECQTLDNKLAAINLDVVERILPEGTGSLILFQGDENGMSVKDTPSEIVKHWLDTRYKNI